MTYVVIAGAACLLLSLPALALAGVVEVIASRFERHH